MTAPRWSDIEADPGWAELTPEEQAPVREAFMRQAMRDPGWRDVEGKGKVAIARKVMVTPTPTPSPTASQAPDNDYDYDAAREAGVSGPDKSGHWPSEFKRDNNDRLILPLRNGGWTNTKTGQWLAEPPPEHRASAERWRKRALAGDPDGWADTGYIDPTEIPKAPTKINSTRKVMVAGVPGSDTFALPDMSSQTQSATVAPPPPRPVPSRSPATKAGATPGAPSRPAYRDPMLEAVEQSPRRTRPHRETVSAGKPRHSIKATPPATIGIPTVEDENRAARAGFDAGLVQVVNFPFDPDRSGDLGHAQALRHPAAWGGRAVGALVWPFLTLPSRARVLKEAAEAMAEPILGRVAGEAAPAAPIVKPAAAPVAGGHAPPALATLQSSRKAPAQAPGYARPAAHVPFGEEPKHTRWSEDPRAYLRDIAQQRDGIRDKHLTATQGAKIKTPDSSGFTKPAQWSADPAGIATYDPRNPLPYLKSMRTHSGPENLGAGPAVERTVPASGGAAPPRVPPTAAAASAPEPLPIPEWKKAGANPFERVTPGSPTHKAIGQALGSGELQYVHGPNGQHLWRYKGHTTTRAKDALFPERVAAGKKAAETRLFNQDTWMGRLEAQADRDRELIDMDPEGISAELDRRVSAAEQEYIRAMSDTNVHPDFYETPAGQQQLRTLEENLDRLDAARERFRAYRGQPAAEAVGGGGQPPVPPRNPATAAPGDVPPIGPTEQSGAARGAVNAGAIEAPTTPLDMRPRPTISREAMELVDPQAYQRIDKLAIPQEYKDNYRRLVAEDVVENGWNPKQVIGFQQIRDEARAMAGDDILPYLRPPKPGETIPPAVRFKMREDVNALNSQAVDLRRQAAAATRSPDERAALGAKADNVERSAKALLDVLIPTRSQDGRNLAYHKMVSELSFDVEYWTNRATRAAGGVLAEGDRLPLATILADASAVQGKQEAMNAARAAGHEAEALRLADEILAETRTAGAVGRDVRRLEATLDDAHAAVDVLHQRRAELTGKIDEARRGLPEAQAGLGQAQKELADLARQEREIQAHMTELGKMRSKLAGQAERKQAKLDELEPLVADLQQQVDAITTKLGRTLDDLRFARKQRDSLKGQDVRAQARLDTIEQANQAAREALDEKRRRIAGHMARLDRTAPVDTILLLRKAGLLTGVKTHVRNLSGNALFQVLEETKRIPASVADIALSLGTGQRTVQGFNPMAMARAGREAATRGVREAGDIMRMGATAQDMAKLDYVKEANTGSRVLDAYINTVFRSLSAEDRIFRVYAIDRSLQAQADLATRQLPRGSRAAARDQLVKDAWEGRNEAMMARAQGDGEFATFNNSNVLTSAISRFKSASPGVARAVDLVMPFVRTPTNIIMRVLDYTPIRLGGAAAEVAGAIARGGLTPERQRILAESLGRGLTGSALITMGAWLYESGYLTATRNRDKGEAARDEAIGRTPVSILVGDQWIPIQSLSPVATLLGVGATLARDDLTLGAITSAAVQTVQDMPFLTGIRQVTEDVANPLQAIPRTAQSIASSFVPTILSDVASLNDPFRRRATNIPEALAARGLGGRDAAPIKLGPMGEVLPNPGYGGNSFLGALNALANPFKGREARELYSPVARGLRDLDVSVTPLQQTLSILGEGDMPERLRVPPDEYNKMALEYGSRAYPDVLAELRAHRALGPLPRNPALRQQALEGRKTDVEQALTSARKEARINAKDRLMALPAR